MARGPILRPKIQRQRMSVGNTKYWEIVKDDPTFPSKIQLGPNTWGVFEDEFDAWLDSKRSKSCAA